MEPVWFLAGLGLWFLIWIGKDLVIFVGAWLLGHLVKFLMWMKGY